MHVLMGVGNVRWKERVGLMDARRGSLEMKGGIPSEDDNAEESNDEEDLRVGGRKANHQGVDANDSKG